MNEIVAELVDVVEATPLITGALVSASAVVVNDPVEVLRFPTASYEVMRKKYVVAGVSELSATELVVVATAIVEVARYARVVPYATVEVAASSVFQVTDAELVPVLDATDEITGAVVSGSASVVKDPVEVLKFPTAS